MKLVDLSNHFHKKDTIRTGTNGGPRCLWPDPGSTVQRLMLDMKRKSEIVMAHIFSGNLSLPFGP